MSESKLLPCPFCGNEVEMYYEGSHDWVVDCEQQGCGIHHTFYIPHIGDEHAEAIKKWNTRAPTYNHAPEVVSINKLTPVGKYSLEYMKGWFECLTNLADRYQNGLKVVKEGE